MKVLRLFVVILFVGLSTSIQAHNINKSPIPTDFTTLSDEDEISISSSMIDEKVLIQWESKIKGVYFEIERSTDGRNYETIATSENVVEISQGTTFQFMDKNPKIENYYRVFYVTPSGNVDYSEVTFASPLASDMTIEGLK